MAVDLPQCPILNGFSEQRQRNILSNFNRMSALQKYETRGTASAVKLRLYSA